MKMLYHAMAFLAVAFFASAAFAQGGGDPGGGGGGDPPGGNWDETADGGGDAGNFPEGDFQSTTSGTFDVITGELDAVDQDAFLITINSATWSAEVISGDESDTRLWLFDTDGNMLMFNDDSSQNGDALHSLLTDTASFPGGGGLVNNPIDPAVGQQVVLVINGFADDALDTGGVQLADSGTNFDGLHGVQAASNGIFGSWENANQGGGTYEIQLSGAFFGSAAVPEPASAMLLGFGALGFAFRRRR